MTPEPVAVNQRDQALAEMERRASSGQLSPQANAAFDELKRRRGLTSMPASDQQPSGQPIQDDSALRPLGVAATGFNKGMGGFVDLINDGLKGLGLPMHDEPFMGTAFIDKYLGGAQLQPQNMFESVLQRAGFEAGANVPMLAGALGVQAGAMAKKAAGSVAPQAASTNLEALKQLPSAIAQQLADISPIKLAAIEEGLALGAGTGAGLVKEIFPEGGRIGEFVGELVGGFAPSVTMGLIRKAKELIHGGVRAVAGLETESETKRRLGGKLSEAATTEQVEAGVKKADELRQAISPGAQPEEGLRLSAGEAIEGGAVTSTQSAVAKGSVSIAAKLRDQRVKNIEEVKNFFTETAPPGNPTAYIEALESQRQKSSALLDIGVARTQSKVDAARGDISKRSADLLTDIESKMFAADQAIDARLQAIGPMLGKKERGQIIRAEYEQASESAFKAAEKDYKELDQLGHAELPISNTLSQLADVQARFPEHLQIISKASPRIGAVLGRLGRDYELVERASKAQADLEIVGGKGLDQRGGFRFQQETQGTGGTKETVGLKSAYPQWYKSIANEKVAGTDNVLDRDTIEKALDTLKTGEKHGLHEKTVFHVEQAIRADSEFRSTSFYDPIMEHLRQTRSAPLDDLRQVRSDTLQLLKLTPRDQGVQRLVLRTLKDGMERDIDELLVDGSPFQARYPEHGALYRQVSEDYRLKKEQFHKGTANKLRQMNKYGDYTKDDESIPALFWRNETSMQDFARAFPNKTQAQMALRDYATEQFMQKAAFKDMKTGRLTIDPGAASEWIAQHEPQLKAFPELAPVFRNTAKMQQEATALHEQVDVFTKGKAGEQKLLDRVEATRHPWELTRRDIDQREARLKRTQDIVDRTRHDWEASKASLFLKQPANVAGARIATASDPIAEYEQAVKLVGKDRDAVAGLNKAIWEGLTEKLQPRLMGVSGETNLGVFHKELQSWISGHGQIMERVLGKEGFTRIQQVNQAVEAIARGGRVGSDTAVNLQVQSALMSTWLSRAFAISSGRVGQAFGVGERVANHLTKTFQRMTEKQQEAILLESFFDPKVFQTLVQAGQHGPTNPQVRAQLRLHLTNLSEQMGDDTP